MSPPEPNTCASLLVYSPVILYPCGLISDGRQVHFSVLPVRQAQQLFDYVVSHLLHELQGLHVVASRSEDLVQPGEVLVQTSLHVAHGTSHLQGEKRQRNQYEVNVMNNSLTKGSATSSYICVLCIIYLEMSNT